MKELTLRDLDKLDIIEVAEDEYDKIQKWCFKNKDLIEENKSNIRNTMKYGIIKVDLKGYENLFRVVYFEVIEGKVYLSCYGYTDNNKEIKNFCGGSGFFIRLKDCWKYFNEKNIEDITFVDIPISEQFLEYMKKKYGENSEEQIVFHCNDMIMIYIAILIYSQLNQESIIRQSRTHTKKNQSKKDKRKGKKPKVKLIKQNIIKLNTDHIQLTEEERNHYKRHTFGWTVRGHWREYQSGKKVWIKPQIRGDKDKVQGKIYEI